MAPIFLFTLKKKNGKSSGRLDVVVGDEKCVVVTTFGIKIAIIGRACDVW